MLEWGTLVLGSLFIAELYGYFLHVLLHSYIFPSLSIGHMNHHISSYPPGKKMRSNKYIQNIKENDVLVFGLGLEWLVPSFIILVFTIFFEWLIGISFFKIAISVSIILLYTIFLFWFLHETLHIKNHPILKIKIIKKWYLKARKMHDIHHHYVNEEGLMNRNYGIAFFLFDRVFGTYLPKLRGKFNKDGAAIAKKRLNKYI